MEVIDIVIKDIKINVMTLKKGFYLKLTIYLFLIVPMVFSCRSSQKLQKDKLIGTWILNKIEIEDKVVFDRNNFSVTKINYFEAARDFYETLSEEVEEELALKAQQTFNTYRKFYYRFTEDSVIFMNANTNFTSKGTYSFDFKEQKIVCHFDSVHTITNNAIIYVKNQKLIIGTKDNIQEFIKAPLN